MRTLPTILVFALALSCQAAHIHGFSRLRFGDPPPPPYSPSNEPNLYVWYKSDALTNTVNGSAIVNWIDSSGHGFTMTPGDGNSAHTPYYTNSYQNGLPGNLFDGVDDIMTNGAAMTQTNCCFMVSLAYGHSGVAELFFTSQDAAEGEELEMGGITVDEAGRMRAGANLSYTTGTNILVTYTLQYATTASKLWSNGVLIASGDVGTSRMHLGMSVGGCFACGSGRYLNGRILEMYWLTNTLADQGNVLNNGVNYLRSKWAHY